MASNLRLKRKKTKLEEVSPLEASPESSSTEESQTLKQISCSKINLHSLESRISLGASSSALFQRPRKPRRSLRETRARQRKLKNVVGVRSRANSAGIITGQGLVHRLVPYLSDLIVRGKEKGEGKGRRGKKERRRRRIRAWVKFKQPPHSGGSVKELKKRGVTRRRERQRTEEEAS